VHLIKAAHLKRQKISEFSKRTLVLKEQNIHPCLKVILVGNNPASLIYTENKKKFCLKIGADCEIIHLEENLSEENFLSTVQKFNHDQNVHGIIIQLPLPKSLQHLEVGSLISPEKDVDGFHPINLYHLLSNQKNIPFFTSCTPKGILTLLTEHGISVAGKKVCLIGRSMIVGKPLAMLLTNHNATVTLCHSQTPNLENISKEADILISAIGKARFITKEFVHAKQIVVDVGINNHQGTICGDVCFDEVSPIVQSITPVPGGVGPMTILSLAENLLESCERLLKK